MASCDSSDHHRLAEEIVKEIYENAEYLSKIFVEENKYFRTFKFIRGSQRIV